MNSNLLQVSPRLEVGGITLDHLASRWDRSPESLHADIARSVRAGADIITLTEVADGKRPAALHHDGYTTLQDRTPWQAGEVACLVSDGFGTVLDWQTTQIGPDLGPGNAVYAIVAVIKVKATGKILLAAESHLPSSVEDKWKQRRGSEFRKIARNYRKAVRAMKRKWKPDIVCVWADWNLNLNLAWVRDWAKRVWSAKGKALGKHKTPAKGTHGNRLIDWPITSGLRKRELRILPLTAGSDHHGIRLRAVA